MPAPTYRHLDTLSVAFVSLLLLSNLLSSAKIIDLQTSLLGIDLVFDAGLLLFPLCYVLGDVLTEVYGYARSRRVIWMGFFAGFAMFASIKLAGVLPAEQNWQEYAGDSSYAAILGGLASGGIIIASVSAYLVGEFSNAYVLARLKVATKGRYFGLRAIASTLVGQGLDTVIFVCIAATFGVFPWEIVPGILLTNYVLKILLEVFILPLTTACVDYLKRSEGRGEHFDYALGINPFSRVQ